MRDEEGRSKEASKVKQTTRQSNTAPFKAVTFPMKNELPRMGLEPTLHSRQSALPLSYQGSSAGWAQISHLIIHQMNRLTIYQLIIIQTKKTKTKKNMKFHVPLSLQNLISCSVCLCEGTQFIALVIPSCPGALFDLASSPHMAALLKSFIKEKSEFGWISGLN